MPVALPLVLAGPVLCRVTPERVTLWLAMSVSADLRLEIRPEGRPSATYAPGGAHLRCIEAGRALRYLQVDLPMREALPVDTWISYEIALLPEGGDTWQTHATWAPDLTYPGREAPGFVIPTRVRSLLHGSCRKPHHRGLDALHREDALLSSESRDAVRSAKERWNRWPAALVLSGDQVYVDDVAAPLLRAVHALLPRLGLPVETLPPADNGTPWDAAALYNHPAGYYHRETLLPRHTPTYGLRDLLKVGVERPVFSSVNASNHLITLAEMLALYLLTWSPACWTGLSRVKPPGLAEAERERYAAEDAALGEFVEDLPAARRVFAHLPVAMMFDDHDITDDWNLSREWEEVVYGNPLSNRIIGNALLAYLINQGWGNAPERSGDDLWNAAEKALLAPGGNDHDRCIEALYRFDEWHFTWQTMPPLVVADTRTRRWRSESAGRAPSGLLDWEALTDLQQTFKGNDAVVLVTLAPVFGVKLIEAVQRVVTWFGHPLAVDAENWMAHPGAAGAILNIFKHPKTSRTFVVLSGDVHYSFVYDVELRGRNRARGPHIWQICSSGLRNAFPEKLLDRLDRLNRWLYSPRSPLNWFTRRRAMRVTPRRPEGAPQGGAC